MSPPASPLLGRFHPLFPMRVSPCELHRQLSADFTKLVQSAATPEDVKQFTPDLERLRLEIKACPDCIKR